MNERRGAPGRAVRSGDGGRRERSARRRRRRGTLLGLLVLSGALLGVGVAAAHNLGDSYLYLQVYEDRLAGRFEIGLPNLNAGLGLEGTADEITAANLDRQSGFLKNYYRDRVEILAAGSPLVLDLGEPRHLAAEGGWVQLPFELVGFQEVPGTLTVDYSVLFDEDSDHRGFLIVEHNWATGTFANESGVSLVFSPSNRRQSLDLTSSGRLRGFLALARLGAEHMLLGLDHMFFLFALLLTVPLRREKGRWRPVERFGEALRRGLGVVTAFLAAHAVALALGAPGWLRLPESLVETVIAASVLLAAADVFFPLLLLGRWWIVFAASLFHGLGFAGALRDLGAVDDFPVLSIVSFHLGVEAGQIFIVALLLPVLFLLRRLVLYRRVALPAAALGIALVSGVWVAERAFGVDVEMRERLPTFLQKVIP